MKWCNIAGLVLVMALAVAFHGCSVIDEDLSDCGDELRLDYDMHLVTNLNIELASAMPPTTRQRSSSASAEPGRR